MCEFDPVKSVANKAKHGIDFVEAQAIWLDLFRLEFGVVDHGGERRTLYVGKLDGRHWTAVVTFRDERVRLISVRRARPDEEMADDHRIIRPDV